jgi:hypothetical protein
MTKFDLLPRAWYSSDYRVIRDGVQLTCLKFQSGPERSVFTLAEEVYLARKEKWSSPNFFLLLDETQIARAEKPSAFSQKLTVAYGQFSYILKPAGRNRFALSERATEVGWAAKQRWFSRKASAELPDDMPIPVCVFVLWLVALMWKRDTDSDSTTMLMIAAG